MKVLVLLNLDNGWDNIVSIADSLESLAYYMEYENVEDLQKQIDNSDWILKTVEVATLPESTLQKSIDKHWS